MQPETEVADGSGTRLIVAARKEAGVNFEAVEGQVYYRSTSNSAGGEAGRLE